MPKRLEFWFDVGSPTAYLAHTQMPGIAERTGAEIAWKPMLLGGVFKATGNTPPGTVEAKSAYYGIDLPRFAKRYGVPFRRNPFFPIMTLGLMRGCLAAQRDGCFQTYADAVFTAMWVEGRRTRATSTCCARCLSPPDSTPMRSSPPRRSRRSSSN